MRLTLFLVIGAIIMSSAAYCRTTAKTTKFQNTEVEYRTSGQNIWQITQAYLKAKRQEPTPKTPIPVRTISPSELNNPPTGNRIYRLGHSTVLIRLDNQWLLADPVFSDRASPVDWIGPKRFHEAPLSLAQLPEIDVVIISHDHYDHLDKTSIQALKEKVKQFVVPLGVGKYLHNWGVALEKITELNWWETRSFRSIQLTATPAQHFSGRGLFDRDSTLWASWVIEGQDTKLFFSGDSGYFGGFKEIGDRFGPFNVTMIETGAYNTLWQTIHMLPEESVQAHLDLKGNILLPIHNSTFDLALHDWFEPLERVSVAAELAGVNLATPRIGEALDTAGPVVQQAWWRQPAKTPLHREHSLALSDAPVPAD